MVATLYLIHIPCVLAEEDKGHHAKLYHNQQIKQPEQETHAYAPNYGTVVGNNGSAMAMGIQSRVDSDTPAIAMGDSAIAAADYSISIGGSSYSDGISSIAMGVLSYTGGNYGLAVGASSHARATESTALGSNSFSLSPSSVALGSESMTERQPGIITELFTNANRQTSGEVSIGNNYQLRQITHIAGGTEKTDAANIGQLQAIDNKITNLNSRFDENVSKNKEFMENMEKNTQIIADSTEDIKKHTQDASQFSTLTQEHKEHAFSALQKTQSHESAASISAQNAAEHESFAHSSAAQVAKFKDIAEHDAQSIEGNKRVSEGALTHIEKSRKDAKEMADMTNNLEMAASKSSHKAAEHEETARVSANEAGQHRDATLHARNTAVDLATQTIEYKDKAKKSFVQIEGYQQQAHRNFIALKKQHNKLLTQERRDKKNIDRKITEDANGVIHIGQYENGTSISVSGQQGDRTITGVAEGVRGNDAANIAQLNRVKNTATTAHAIAQKNTSRIKNLENQLSKTNAKIDRGLAASAALTSLFQPYGVGKFNVTAGIGGYGSSQALAIGTGYRINKNMAIKAGAAYSASGSMMYNASFNVEW